jgi:hypothetical protein
MCGYKAIRYVHRMMHPTGLELATGCICAGQMSSDLEAAERRDRDMKNASARMVSRERAMRHVRAQLDMLRGRANALGDLERIKRRAVDLVQRAGADSTRHNSTRAAVQEIEAAILRDDAAAAVEDARRRLPAFRLARELARPIWHDTRKGHRMVTWDGDCVQTFQRENGAFGFGFHLAGQPMRWSKEDFAAPAAAKRVGIWTLANALRRAGRLPKPSRD